MKEAKKLDLNQKADICLILEGSYPYVRGGVSSWVNDLMLSHKDMTFSIVSIIPENYDETYKYELPSNLIGIHNIRLQEMPTGRRFISRKKLREIEETLKRLLMDIYIKKKLNSFEELISYLSLNRKVIGKHILLNSLATWGIIRHMYNETMKNGSFIDYFWSWKILFGGLFSVLLSALPKASCYHAICTGYAGIYLARAHFETGSACVLTEHGIYTNERRIEISTADWLYSQSSFSLSVAESNRTSDLQHMWTEIFSIYSKFAYEVCSYVTTLFEGNRQLQINDGAPPERTIIIPNGINYAKYSSIKKKPHLSPTIALIGRVVLIKDIKTFIQAVGKVKQKIPDIVAYIIGSQDEEPLYVEECIELVKYLELSKNIIFTGNQNISDFIGRIDILVLTSLSEAQPLVILECGAAAIPSIVTDVGSCRELIEGAPDEDPNLGAGGIVVPLSSHEAVSGAIELLLTNPSMYYDYSKSIQERVKKYYTSELQHLRYQKIYDELIKKGS